MTRCSLAQSRTEIPELENYPNGHGSRLVGIKQLVGPRRFPDTPVKAKRVGSLEALASPRLRWSLILWNE